MFKRQNQQNADKIFYKIIEIPTVKPKLSVI